MNDETLEASHPHRWLYGGIIERVPWGLAKSEIRRWDGETETVRPGDTLVVLRTAAWVTTVGVEREETTDMAA